LFVHLKLKNSVKDFVSKELSPRAQQIDKDNEFPMVFIPTYNRICGESLAIWGYWELQLQRNMGGRVFVD
jgi:hypothetical protein